MLDDLPWAEVSFVGVGSDEVEVELIDAGFGEEVAAAAESFQVVELVLDKPMDGFDVTLIGVGGGRDALGLEMEEAEGAGETGAGAVRLEGVDKLAAVVGLPDEIFQIQPAGLELRRDAVGAQGVGPRGAPLGEGEELQAAAHFAGGVLDEGQAAEICWPSRQVAFSAAKSCLR